MSERPTFPKPLHVARRIADHRRKLVILGVLLVLAGAATVALPYVTTVVIGAAAGWLLWLAGAAMVGVALLLGVRRSLAPALLASLAAIAAGAYMLLHPAVGALAVAMLLGVVLILEGGFELALGFDIRSVPARRWLFASSLASVLSGMAVLFGAGDSRIVLAWLLGFALATSGLALFAVALATRTASYLSDPAARAAAGADGRGRSPSMPST